MDEQRIKQLKKEIKTWEHSFLEENGRKPNKKDISQVADIAVKYKEYAKLKSLNASPDADEEKKAESPRPSAVPATISSPVPISAPESASSPVSVSSPNDSVQPASIIPELPAKSKRFEIGDAPISKADIGLNIDRFAKLAQEKKKKQEKKLGSVLDDLGAKEATISVQRTPRGIDGSNFSLHGETVANPVYEDVTGGSEGFIAKGVQKSNSLHKSLKDENGPVITTQEYLEHKKQKSDELQQFYERKQELEEITKSKPSSEDSKYNSQEVSSLKEQTNSSYGLGSLKTSLNRLDIADNLSGGTPKSSYNEPNNEPPLSKERSGNQKLPADILPPPLPKRNSKVQSLMNIVQEQAEVKVSTQQGERNDSSAKVQSLMNIVQKQAEVKVSTQQGERNDSSEQETKSSVNSSRDQVDNAIVLSQVNSSKSSNEQVDKDNGIQPSDEPETGIESPHQTRLAKKVPVKNLPSLLIKDLFSRIEKHGILRCKLFRKKSILGQGPQTYLLHNEANNSFLLSAKKNILSKSTSYVLSDHPDDISKDSPHYVAKLKANFMRTQFVLTDTRRPSKPVEIGFVNYSKNVLPRELHVAITSTAVNDHLDENYTKDISADFKNKNDKALFFIRNKAPRWNEATQSHCLNFGGRVTQPSIKNMQLISDQTGLDYILLQFGRCGPDFFTLDVRWPLTPIEAFGIAITTFDAYDNA